MQESIHYRKMATEEISRIGEVNREETVHAEYTAVPHPATHSLTLKRIEKTPPLQINPWSQQGIEKRITDWKPALEQGGQMYGAFVDEALAGFVILGPKRQDNSAEIMSLFIDTEHRRRGIAYTLMEWAEQTAVSQQINLLFLHSNPTESAVLFYLSQGFIIVRLTATELVPSLPEDIIMAKRLDTHP